MIQSRRSPERDALLDSVLGLGKVLSACAEESERRRTLTPAAVDALRTAGLFAVAAPRAVGGLECDPLTQLEVFEAVARLDTSAGWCLMIGSLIGALAGAYLPDAAVARIFSGPFPICAGHQVPSGTARRVDGGYLVHGRWAFGSGVRHAQWVLTGAAIAPQDPAPSSPDPTPAMISVAVPTDQLTIEDTWDVAGLRGSGSDHYRMEGVFVPEEHACPFPCAPPRRGGPMYRLPLLAFLATGHVGFALGAARRALDEIAAVAPRRIKVWTQEPIGSHPAFQLDLGRAEAKLAAARAYAFDVLGTMGDRARTGQALSIQDWAENRLMTTYVTEVATEVATFAYRSGGGSALYSSSPLQRCFRDLSAASQHIAAADDAYEFAGKARLGAVALNPLLDPRPEPSQGLP